MRASVTGRTPAEKGGDPARGEEETSWDVFAGNKNGDAGDVVVGMTDEIARTGK